MLPISTYEPGETVIAAGAITGKLLLLRVVVEVAKEGTQIARISEPGSVFGELAVLLDKPHTADVRAVERSVFSVADGATLLTSDPAATLYIAAILAARLDAANVALIEIKRQLETGKPRVAIAQTVEKIADLLSSGGGNLVYSGYPYDPFASAIRGSISAGLVYAVPAAQSPRRPLRAGTTSCKVSGCYGCRLARARLALEAFR
jgi:CRP/FNR family transcriptional regulator, cyclic AMP receptor protein